MELKTRLEAVLFLRVCPDCSTDGAASPELSASFLKHRSGALNWAPQAPVVQVRLWQNNCGPKTAACFGFFSLLVHIYPVMAVIDEPFKA